MNDIQKRAKELNYNLKRTIISKQAVIDLLAEVVPLRLLLASRPSNARQALLCRLADHALEADLFPGFGEGCIGGTVKLLIERIK